MTDARPPRKTAYVPQSQRHTAQMHVRLPHEDAAWWREEARRRGCTLAELLAMARRALEA
jgi:hypothetical protein